MHRHRHPIAVALAALLVLAFLAPAASAEHERRTDRRDVARLAQQLDDAAYHANRLSDRRSRGQDRHVNGAFVRLNAAANDYHRIVDSGRFDARDAERAFERVVARYWELRGDFRHYHGPTDVRQAFHRVTGAVADLYWVYTGRNLLDDEPRARGAARHDRYDDRGYDDRYDRDRRDDRDRERARRTRPRH